MGQATVLPDPLDETATSPTMTSIASADDLLSQLAGEEIDRLLAESEAERAAVAEPAPAPAPSAVPVAPAGDPPPANGPADDVIAATLAAAPTPAPAPLPEPVATPVQAVAPAPEVLAPPEAISPEPEPDATAAEERAALTLDPLVSLRLPDEAPVGSTLEESDALPLYLRPLAWLNAPLAACSESLREVVGKVAIVTLVNAIAVLAYVLLFRKH